MIVSYNLERMKRIAILMITQEMADKFAEPTEVVSSAYYDWLHDVVTIRIVQPMWGETPEEIEATYPANWWEAFKEKWVPKGLKKICPIKYTTIKLTARAIYPKLAFPEEEWKIFLDKETHNEFS